MMKKILLLTLLMFVFAKVSAQLGTEHWFSAMYDGQSNTGPYQYLYLSTNDSVPFTVTIYSNNVKIGERVISKGSPQYMFIPRQYIIVENGNTQELFKPINKGLYVKAERQFFANLRFGVTNHAEIVTSKGAAALGKDFYTVVAPNLYNDMIVSNGQNYGFQASVIATEDNTTVTINKFNKLLEFTDGSFSRPLTFKLNRGQSYIIDGRGVDSGNKDGFIGTRVIADKPVSLANGNINGQYVLGANQDEGSDILMDQSVPVENLGNEFGIISGMGTIIGTGTDQTNRGMERAIIVGTKNGTDIYINNSTVPVKTINEGEYYFVPDTYYSKKSSNHYNLYIKTSQNVYVYQVLGGVPGRAATGSMNFIPPLSCYLPLTVGEIGFVDNLEPNRPLQAKLNIITESGAKVKVNGVQINPASGYGPFLLDGNNAWETYSIPNIRGNITVESDKAVNAGLAGGDGNAVGYAGYFAGFSIIPLIVKKEGNCVPDIVLELPEGYTSYQWLVRDEVTGDFNPVSGANSNTYKPTMAGIYKAEVQKGSCGKVTTQEFKLVSCPTATNKDLIVCTDASPIVPKLTYSSQSTDWGSITISTQPTKGTLSLDKVNKIFNYTANTGVTGSDNFKYSFCGLSSVPDCEEVNVKVTIGIVANDDVLYGCKVDATNANFDLTKANLTTDASVTEKKYYKTQQDADNDTGNNLIPTSEITNYKSPIGFVYVRLKNATCGKTVKIELRAFPSAELITDTYKVCDDKQQGQIDVKLDDLVVAFLKNANYYSNVKFYADASAAGTALPNNWSYTQDTTIYMKVESPDGCAPQIFPINFAISPKVPVDATTQIDEICDDEDDFFDGKKTVANLDDYKSLFTSDNTITAKFYISKEDAQNNLTNNITKFTIQNQQKFFIRLSKNGFCDGLVELTLKIKTPEKSTVLEDQKICPEKLTSLDAGSGFLKYDWYAQADPNTSLSQDQVLKNVGLGDYFVILTAANGCKYQQPVKVTSVEIPVISEIVIQNNTVTITAKKGNPPYLYSLDGINYQASNVFTNLSPGLHKVYLISKDGCQPVVQEFSIIAIYNVLTPNGDGYNDVLDMSFLSTKKEVKFMIHDRDGAKVFDGNQSNKFIWDGRHNGKFLPTSSYWYVLEWKDFDYSPPVKYSGWILLKNRD